MIALPDFLFLFLSISAAVLLMVFIKLLERSDNRLKALEKELVLVRAQVVAREQDLVLAQARLLVAVGEQGRESLKIREME